MISRTLNSPTLVYVRHFHAAVEHTCISITKNDFDLKSFNMDENIPTKGRGIERRFTTPGMLKFPSMQRMPTGPSTFERPNLLRTNSNSCDLTIERPDSSAFSPSSIIRKWKGMTRQGNENVQSQFGITLTEAMKMQKDKYPNMQVPWILTTLCQKIIELNGKATEGIFRIEADRISLNYQRKLLSKWVSDQIVDCHTAACLLKQWLRELTEPLIPANLYDEVLMLPDGEVALNQFIQMKIGPHKPQYMTILYLVRFLKDFGAANVVAQTKMDTGNLATVFARNVIRNPQGVGSDLVSVLTNNEREKRFIRNLIEFLDTSPLLNT